LISEIKDDFMNNEYWDKISDKAWRYFCLETYNFHFRKTSTYAKSDLIKYFENMSEFELKIYFMYENLRDVPSRKFAFHKDFIRVYYDIFRGRNIELFRDIPFYKKALDNYLKEKQ
jgi:hypothetical protein